MLRLREHLRLRCTGGRRSHGLIFQTRGIRDCISLCVARQKCVEGERGGPALEFERSVQSH